MDSVVETVRINRLLDIYGRLLTTSQYEIMCDYYQANLSLAEISEIRKISRTAVQDAIKKSIEKLENCEEKLGICKVFDEYKDNPIIEEIEGKIKNGIWIFKWKISGNN